MTSLRHLAAALLAALAATALAVGGLVGLADPASARPPFPEPLAAVAEPSLVLAAGSDAVASGHTVSLSGRLSGAGGEAGTGADQPVRLQAQTGDGGWLDLAALTTGSQGEVASVQAPPATTTYRLLHDGPNGVATTSGPVTVRVQPVLGAWEQAAVRLGSPATVRGVVGSGLDGTVRLQRRSGSRWLTVARAQPAAGGAFELAATAPAVAGWSRWRLVVGDGVARAALPRLEAFRLHRYSVATRGRVKADLAEFREQVAAVYDHPRGWARAHHRFREVRRGGDFTVVLSEARYLPSFSGVCSTTYSCRVGRYVIINDVRWRTGSPYFPGTLRTYRRMLVNHETGHWLGNGHAYCSGRGRRAPVMQQQSKGMQGCRVNPWPLPREVRATS